MILHIPKDGQFSEQVLRCYRERKTFEVAGKQFVRSGGEPMPVIREGVSVIALEVDEQDSSAS